MKFNIEKLRKPALFAGILGAVKLATDAFGYNIITDDQVNIIANGLAAIFAVIAALINPNKTE